VGLQIGAGVVKVVLAVLVVLVETALVLSQTVVFFLVEL
jgi:hypothetical protein